MDRIAAHRGCDWGVQGPFWDHRRRVAGAHAGAAPGIRAAPGAGHQLGGARAAHWPAGLPQLLACRRSELAGWPVRHARHLPRRDNGQPMGAETSSSTYAARVRRPALRCWDLAGAVLLDPLEESALPREFATQGRISRTSS